MMRRKLSDFTGQKYDLIVVGGGIFGICVAWDATLRGLSVALLERGDFAHATSANCFKIVHGGIRYLQHSDFSRVRESLKELNTLLRIAPHQVYPLPFVVPTYGHGMRGKWVLKAGQLLYNLITFDRNLGIIDPHRKIPLGYAISRRDCLELFPGLSGRGLTGAVIFYDGQMYSPARLALSYLKSAVGAGADAGNYIEVTDFLRRGESIVGVEAEDKMTGEKMEILGKIVLNTTGPWAERMIRLQKGLQRNPELCYSRDAFIVVDRPLVNKYALAVLGSGKDPAASFSRGRRHLFIVPWRGYTIVGVWHSVYKGEPDEFTVSEKDLQWFIDEINEAYPAISLGLNDISTWNAGIVPSGDNEYGATNLTYAKRALVIDHAKDHNVEGLLTVIGIRYTTSRRVAERVVDLVFRKLGKEPPKCETAVTPIYGGQIEDFEEFVSNALKSSKNGLSPGIIRALVHNHGSEYQRILDYVGEDPSLGETLGTSGVIKAEGVNAVREEMAQKLGDVVFRRTDLGSAGYPGESEIRVCAELMAKELGWDESRLRNEINEVNSAFPNF
jgi:glycerol-3-phosphate dehydrogenase